MSPTNLCCKNLTCNVLIVDAVFVESRQIDVTSHSCLGLCGLDLASKEYGLLVR